jgi:hypothetical protein
MAVKKAAAEASKSRELVRISFKSPRGGAVTLRDYTKPDGTLFKLVDPNTREPTAYQLTSMKEFDLTRPFEKQVVEGFRNHPIFAGMLNFVSLQDEAKEVVDEFELSLEAGNIVKALGKSASSMLRIFGVNVVKLTELEQKAMLLRIAKDTPKRIIALKEDPLYAYRVLLFDGKAAGVFSNDGGVWAFKGQPIGSTDEMAVQWIAENKDIMTVVKSEVTNKLES